MSASATAGGAGTIVNAMALGKGAAFGLGFKVTAEVREAKTWSVHANGKKLPPSKARLAVESAKQVTKRGAYRIDVQSDIPPERGLKSSSAVAVAIVRACLNDQSLRWSNPRVLKAAAQAGLRSKTSLTGAYDDAAACLLGGVVLTDNKKFRLLGQANLPQGLQALVRIPKERLPTRSLQGSDFSSIRSLVKEAWRAAAAKKFDQAIVLNSAAYAGYFGHTTRFTFEALREGAWAAGLSGKGPAEVALGRTADLERLQASYPESILVPIRRGKAA
jgi:shikimate kinase